MSTTEQVQNEEWRPVRTHAIFRRFQRGPGNTKRFIGQLKDEKLRRIVRKHPIFYVWSCIPLLLSLVFLMLLSWLEATNGLPESAFPILYSICGLAIIGSAIYCAFRIFVLWWVNVDIVTNKRVLTWRGFLHPTRNETTLEKVQQVAVDQNSLLSLLVSYGTVHVYLAGGKALLLEDVPNPKAIRDDIEGVRQSYRTAKPVDTPPPPNDSALASKLETLAKKASLPRLPNADAALEHRRSPTDARGPLRRFGGPLRLKCDVHYDAEEYTVMYIQRSRGLLAVRLIIPVLLLLGTLVGAFRASAYVGQFAIAFFVILVGIGLMIVNYIDDVFILTNKRIIDIDRKFVILATQSTITTYDKISKIEVKSPDVIQLAMDIGNLFIETQGANPNISMRHIAHPLFIQDKIYGIKGFKEKVDKIKAKNDRKDELNEWFSTILITLEQKVAVQGAPNLLSLDLLTAFERAIDANMELVVIGESDSYPHLGPGKIAMQIPAPGSAMKVDLERPDEKPHIQVILSKRYRGFSSTTLKFS